MPLWVVRRAVLAKGIPTRLRPLLTWLGYGMHLTHHVLRSCLYGEVLRFALLASRTRQSLAIVKHEGWNDFTHKTHGGFSVDLKGFIKAELRKAGLQTTDISVSSIDTAANSAYYSHYRSTRRHDPEDLEGRNGFVVCIL